MTIRVTRLRRGEVVPLILYASRLSNQHSFRTVRQIQSGDSYGSQSHSGTVAALVGVALSGEYMQSFLRIFVDDGLVRQSFPYTHNHRVADIPPLLNLAAGLQHAQISNWAENVRSILNCCGITKGPTGSKTISAMRPAAQIWTAINVNLSQAEYCATRKLSRRDGPCTLVTG